MFGMETIYAAEVGDEQERLSHEAGSKVFNEMRSVAAGIKSSEPRKNFDKQLRRVEDQWMAERHSKNPDAKWAKGTKRAGEWKYRTYLPGRWTSSKSVLGNALDRGVEIHDGMSKKECETANKQKKVTSAKTEKEKFDFVMDTALKIFDKLSPEEMEEMCTKWALKETWKKVN